VRATYRKGIGAAGNVRAGQLSQALDRPLGFKGVTNPVPATGAVDAEPPAAARRSIPITVRTLGRAVSLQDFADFALAFAGIGKAEATVLSLPVSRTIVVTVADGAGEPPAPSTVDRLRSAITAEADPNVVVVVLPCRAAAFRLSLKVRTAPDRDSGAVRAEVRSALRTAYGRAARSLGEPVQRSAVVAAAAGVPGVVAVDLDRLHREGTTPSLQERLLPRPAEVVDGRPLAAELLALSDLGLDLPTEMT
jgi:predicted phage baseplate assembly protein